MKLDTEFIRLPLRFDAARLVEEVTAFGEQEWRAHPSGLKGNSALILISRKGEQNDHFFGPMQPAPALQRCPYIQQVLACFQVVFGRSRLMRLAPFSEVPPHSDINYYWRHRVRIHIPVITDPEIRFVCNGKAVHMAAGEAWLFDSWKLHTVINPTQITRIHLVADTAGTPEFWRMVAASECPFGTMQRQVVAPQWVPFEPGRSVTLRTEQFTHEVIMSPGEVDGLAMDLLAELDSGKDARIEAFTQLVNEFRWRWRAVWSLYGPTARGWRQFQAIIEDTHRRLKDFSDIVVRGNRAQAAQVFVDWVLSAALNPEQILPPPHQWQQHGKNPALENNNADV